MSCVDSECEGPRQRRGEGRVCSLLGERVAMRNVEEEAQDRGTRNSQVRDKQERTNKKGGTLKITAG